MKWSLMMKRHHSTCSPLRSVQSTGHFKLDVNVCRGSRHGCACMSRVSRQNGRFGGKPRAESQHAGLHRTSANANNADSHKAKRARGRRRNNFCGGNATWVHARAALLQWPAWLSGVLSSATENAPTNRSELEIAMGALGVARRFMPAFAEVALPLHKLLAKDWRQFKWEAPTRPHSTESNGASTTRAHCTHPTLTSPSKSTRTAVAPQRPLC